MKNILLVAYSYDNLGYPEEMCISEDGLPVYECSCRVYETMTAAVEAFANTACQYSRVLKGDPAVELARFRAQLSDPGFITSVVMNQ